jgi:outer membrane lipoprotein-sorting protein
MMSARAASPKPEDIVKQMLQTYRKVQTYTETATESLKIMNRTTVSLHRFRYEAPNKFYYDVRQKDKLIAAVASDGKRMQVFNLHQGLNDLSAPAKMSELKPALERLDMMTQNDPFSFLMGEDLLPRGTKATFVKMDKIAGKPVYQLELKPADGQRKTFWIGKDDRLLYRVQHVVAQTRGGVTETVTVNETHSNMKLNETLPEDAFTIKTPK